MIDTTNSSWNMPNFPKSGKLSYGPITSWRYGNPTANTGRLVFELSEPAAPVAAFMLPPKQSDSARKPGYRIVIDISNRGKTAFALARSALKKTPYLATSKLDSALNEQADNTNFSKVEKKPEQNNNLQTGGKVVELKSPEMRPKRWVVTIDAGHGGEDPGAGGASGSREKDITLAIAKKLKTYVDAEPNMRGVLTRDGDYFVSLGGRVVKARKLRADLFISIHADSFTKSSARGSSVFALSERGATSATARYLAQKENQSDLIGGVSLKDKDPILAKTLLDLSQAATINDSLKLGKAVLDYVEEINVLHKKHVEQAGFAVLKSPDIPSILVETAFISNPEEERKLNDNNHQHQLAKSILAGIKKYFAANPALARTVADND